MKHKLEIWQVLRQFLMCAYLQIIYQIFLFTFKKVTKHQFVVNLTYTHNL
jgi:hypothetical protein